MNDFAEVPTPPQEASSVLTSEKTPLISFQKESTVIPQPYIDNPPHAVTRATFADWLTRGLRYSRGNLLTHADYAMWTGAVANFDPFQTIDAFIKAGGYKSLSDQEKTYMQAHYDKVSSHAKFPYSVANLDPQIKFHMADRDKYLSNSVADSKLWFEGSTTARLLPPEFRRRENYLKEHNISWLELASDDRTRIHREWREAQDAEIQHTLEAMSKEEFLAAIRSS